MDRKEKYKKHLQTIKKHSLFVLFYEFLRRTLMLFYKTYCNIYTIIKLKGNGVIYSKLISNGVPLIEVKLGGRLIFGKNFSMNNGRYFNKIGRQQPCSFVVAKKACLRFGDNVGVSHSAFFCTTSITLGNGVMIGGNCVFYDTDFHSLNFENRKDRLVDDATKKSAAIHIKDNVFIGAHSTILKGVTIGERSIIAAGSIVSKSIPPDEIWGGNPINYIKHT